MRNKVDWGTHTWAITNQLAPSLAIAGFEQEEKTAGVEGRKVGHINDGVLTGSREPFSEG